MTATTSPAAPSSTTKSRRAAPTRVLRVAEMLQRPKRVDLRTDKTYRHGWTAT